MGRGEPLSRTIVLVNCYIVRPPASHRKVIVPRHYYYIHYQSSLYHCLYRTLYSIICANPRCTETPYHPCLFCKHYPPLNQLHNHHHHHHHQPIFTPTFIPTTITTAPTRQKCDCQHEVQLRSLIAIHLRMTQAGI